MAIKISAKSTKQLSSGSSFRAAGKSGTSILNAAPKKGSFTSRPVPKTSLKIGTYKGSSLTVGIGSSSFSRTIAFGQAPKPTTRTNVFKNPTPIPVVKKPGIMINPVVKPVSIKFAVKPTIPKKSSSGDGSSGPGKVVSIKQDKANKYFQANPGARAKDYV